MATDRQLHVIIACGHLRRHQPQPPHPGNVTYLLWMIMGYLLVQSVWCHPRPLGDIFAG